MLLLHLLLDQAERIPTRADGLQLLGVALQDELGARLVTSSAEMIGCCGCPPPASSMTTTSLAVRGLAACTEFYRSIALDMLATPLSASSFLAASQPSATPMTLRPALESGHVGLGNSGLACPCFSFDHAGPATFRIDV